MSSSIFQFDEGDVLGAGGVSCDSRGGMVVGYAAVIRIVVLTSNCCTASVGCDDWVP